MTQVNPGGGFTYDSGLSNPGPPPAYTNPGAPGIAQPAPVGGMGMGMALNPQQMAMMQMQAQIMQAAMTPQAMCKMSPFPVTVQCPFCQATTTTTVVKKVGARNYFFAVAFTLTCFCCIVPLLWDQLKFKMHHCGNCQKEIGFYDPPRRRRR